MTLKVHRVDTRILCIIYVVIMQSGDESCLLYDNGLMLLVEL